jgi:HlyD family secretion protein
LDQKFKGVVTEIANSANTSSQLSADQVTSFEVRIMLLENSYKHLISAARAFPFRPGMTASVEILTQKKDNILSIPIEAVTARSDSELNKSIGKKTNFSPLKASSKETSALSEIVFVSKNSLVRIRKVKTGIQDNNYIEIVTGLDSIDEVVVAPYSAISKKLKDSTSIKVVDKQYLFNEK